MNNTGNAYICYAVTVAWLVLRCKMMQKEFILLESPKTSWKHFCISFLSGKNINTEYKYSVCFAYVPRNFEDHKWIRLRKPVKVKIMNLSLFAWCMFDSRDERIYWKKNLYCLMEYNNSLFHCKFRLIVKLRNYFVSSLKLGVHLNTV